MCSAIWGGLCISCVRVEEVAETLAAGKQAPCDDSHTPAAPLYCLRMFMPARITSSTSSSWEAMMGAECSTCFLTM